jgi:hypothetical protein
VFPGELGEWDDYHDGLLEADNPILWYMLTKKTGFDASVDETIYEFKMLRTIINNYRVLGDLVEAYQEWTIRVIERALSFDGGSAHAHVINGEGEEMIYCWTGENEVAVIRGHGGHLDTLTGFVLNTPLEEWLSKYLYKSNRKYPVIHDRRGFYVF